MERYKKGYGLILMGFFFLFLSCQSQGLDLEKIILPVNRTELKQLGLTPTGAGVGTEAVQYTNYSSDIVEDGKQTLDFAKIKIEDSEDSESYTEGVLRMYGKNGSDKFEGYRLNITDPVNLSELVNYFLSHKDRFKLVFDNGKDDSERARVIISEQNKTTYLVLSTNTGEGKIKGYMDAISSQEIPLLNSRLQRGAFGYYSEYLEYRKHKSAGFGYLDFLKELNNQIYYENNNLK